MTDLTIQGYKFVVPDAVVAKYAVGYVIADEGEAHALSQTMLENLRNNFASKVKGALNGAESLTDSQVSTLQSEFTTYAEAYKFGVRTAGSPRAKLDPLSREMLNLAKEDFRRAYKAKYNETADKELVDERAAQLVDKRADEYRKRAQAILKQKQGTADDATLEAVGL